MSLLKTRPFLDNPLRIVSIGGGTGLSTLLQGLKPYSISADHSANYDTEAPYLDLTAVVTVTDDGGSSGRLRREFEVLPPGDIRNCLVALSEDEALLSKLFQYRFEAGRGLKGHSFGNLFLAALTHVTGDFAAAVKVTSEVLAIAGRIYPSTGLNVDLQATLENGKVVTGETQISKSPSRIKSVSLLPAECEPLPETLEAIEAADLITMGPGSLYTSVIPNLLVKKIPEAIQRSRAMKVYFVNLMWQPKETLNHSASDHVAAILDHAGCSVLDCVVLNNRPISPDLLKKYALQRARPVENDVAKIEELGLQVIARDLLHEDGTVRHDPVRLAGTVFELAAEARKRSARPGRPPRLQYTGIARRPATV